MRKTPFHLFILEGVYENPDEVEKGMSMRLAVLTCFMQLAFRSVGHPNANGHTVFR